MQVEKTEYRVAAVDDIPDREGLLVRAGDLEFGIFKADGQICAYENRCVHQGGPVCSGVVLGRTQQVLDDTGEIVEEFLDDTQMRLICPWHGWEYDLRTGELAHDRRLRLRRVDFVVRDGVIFVTA